MTKAFCLVLLASGISLLAKSAPLTSGGHNWHNRHLANCLRMNVPQAVNVTPNDVLRYIRRNNYIIVPASNPPTSKQIRPAVRPARSTRDTSTSTAATVRHTKCPFTYEVKDFDYNVLPRFISYARCEGCDDKCKPLMFTHQLLSHKCNKVWVWTQRTLPIAFVWVDKE